MGFSVWSQIRFAADSYTVLKANSSTYLALLFLERSWGVYSPFLTVSKRAGKLVL
jgi:hypothetical protein